MVNPDTSNYRLTIAAIRSLNRLECVGETLRAALNALATHAPDWLSSIAPSEWFDRYSTRIEESRLPKGEEARREYGNLLGADGSYLLTALFEDPSLTVLRALPAVKNLQRTWLYQYYAEEGHLRWRQAKDLLACVSTLPMTRKLGTATKGA